MLLNTNDVSVVLHLSKSTIYRRMKQGKFPRPIENVTNNKHYWTVKAIRDHFATDLDEKLLGILIEGRKQGRKVSLRPEPAKIIPFFRRVGSIVGFRFGQCQENSINTDSCRDGLAEREGFEPPVPRKGQLISSQPRSAAPAPLRARDGIVGDRRTRGNFVRNLLYTLGETTPSGAGSIGTCPGCAATRASQAVTFG